MNAQNAPQYLPLVKALAEGKLQECSLDVPVKWTDVDSVVFSRKPECYRIKPTPREFWIVEGHGRAFTLFTVAQEQANGVGAKLIHVREVL